MIILSHITKVTIFFVCLYSINDPTAGSPTVTLLRLLLPLNYKIYCNLKPITIN